MLWVNRSISKLLLQLADTRPAILLTGIRQVGKSALLQHLFPDAKYITFDHYHNIEEAKNAPSRFIESLTRENQVILDEIQYVPELFQELKIQIDTDRQNPARWLLTGSHKFALLESARESLAGRIGIIELESLGVRELQESFNQDEIAQLIYKGGFPEIWSNNEINWSHYLDDYITSYLEKDLRSIIQTPNLRDFHRFMRSCALRCGSMVNYSDISRDTGISPNTAKAWMNVLVRSGAITLLEPWFTNFSKRMAKTPKLFFNDQGLLCRLLNIPQNEEWKKHPLSESLWENFVFNELIRSDGISASSNLYYYRDQNKVEIDFLIERENKIELIEAKLAERPGKTNLKRVAKAITTYETICYCACSTPSERIIPGEVSLYNPLLVGLE